MSFFLLLLILFIVLPLIRVGIRIWQFRRQMRNFMNDPFGTGQNTAGRSRRQPEQPPQRHKKKIDPDVGEYVAFTEVTVESTVSDGTTEIHTVETEQQIEDVEWEDIK